MRSLLSGLAGVATVALAGCANNAASQLPPTPTPGPIPHGRAYVQVQPRCYVSGAKGYLRFWLRNARPGIVYYVAFGQYGPISSAVPERANANGVAFYALANLDPLDLAGDGLLGWVGRYTVGFFPNGARAWRLNKWPWHVPKGTYQIVKSRRDCAKGHPA